MAGGVAVPGHAAADRRPSAALASSQVLNVSKWVLPEEERGKVLPPLNPYDNELVMPLAEFVRHPIAAELLHDNEAMQARARRRRATQKPPSRAHSARPPAQPLGCSVRACGLG